MARVVHLWSLVGFLVAGAVLIAVAVATVPTVIAGGVVVYVASVLGLFGVSAAYHCITWHSATARAWMRRLDHSMIFLLIAGTYTPIALLALNPPDRTVVLAVVWGGAAAGMGMKLAWPHAPRWLGVPLYIGLGWVAVFVLPDLLTHAGPTMVALLLAGGLLYTTGAICYATRWPNPWPRTFGYHEFFHTAVTAAALCHYAAVWLVLAG